MVILPLKRILMWLWHKKLAWTIQVVLLFWSRQELPSVCDWYNAIFLPDCHLELITLELLRRYQNGIYLWLYFLSAHLSFKFYFCGGWSPPTSLFCMLLLLLFFRFMLENVLVYTSILPMLQWIKTLAGQFTFVALQYSNIGIDHLNSINIWHLSTD